MRSLTEELYQAGLRQLRQDQRERTRWRRDYGELFEVSIIVGVLAHSHEEAERIAVTEAVNVPAKLAKYSTV